MSVSSFRLQFALLIASVAILHIFGLFYGQTAPSIIFLLTFLLATSAATLFVMGLKGIPGSGSEIAGLRVELFSRIAACAFITLSIGFAPSCPFLLWGISLPTRLCLLIITVTVFWFAFKRAALFVGLLAVASILCRAPFLAAPVDPKHSDMLPLVLLACKRFLSGANPYSHYLMPWKLPLTYLPAAWLPFLPAQALGMDPRWFTIMFACGAIVVIFRAFPILEDDPTASLKKLLFAMLLLSSLDLRFSAITPEPVFWLALSLFILFLSRDNQIKAALAMGVCLAARQQAILLLPFYLIYLFSRVSADSRRRCLALTVAVPVSLCLPFLISSPGGFMSGIYTRFGQFALEKWINERAWENSLSFAPFFFEHELHYVLTPIIVVIQLVLYGLAMRRLRQLKDLLCFMGLSLLSFLLFSPIIWPYMFTPLLILLVASFLRRRDPAETRRSLEKGPPDERARRP